MPKSQTENICLILDVSRSMTRRDYLPNRYEVCKKGILEFVELNRSDKVISNYALVVISNEIKLLADFQDKISEPEQFAELLNNFEVGGPSKIVDGIGFAIKLHMEDIRKTEFKKSRILLFSDGRFTESQITPKKMANLANSLSITIDILQIGEFEPSNPLKILSNETKGVYNYCKNNIELKDALRRIALNYSQGFQNKTQDASIIFEKIAVPLKTESELKKDYSDIVARIRRTSTYKKCGICFQDSCPICKNTFQIDGRYCPNCGNGYHIHCFVGWAETFGKYRSNGVARCPHCFYLVKVPGEVTLAQKMHAAFKIEKNSNVSKKEEGFRSIKDIAENFGDTAIYSACPVCQNIFEENEEVYKCGNPECNAIYHEDCFEQVNDNPCKICGEKIILN